MELLTTAAQMQAIDSAAIGRYRIPGIVLMENAGRAFVDLLSEAVGGVTGRHVTTVCGKGNNGGDGFVIARHLLNRGARVDVLLLTSRAAVGGDAAVNLAALLALRPLFPKTLRIIAAGTPSAFRRLVPGDIIIDAIFGTGFSGAPHGAALAAIEWINRSHAFVAAVDIPSGVDAGTGETGGAAVHAHVTVTMGAPKIGSVVGEGALCTGKLRVAEISIPRPLITPPIRPVYRVERGDIRTLLPIRPRTAHKYSVGKIFVLAGSRAFTGAPALAALSALRSGAGAVVLGVPRSIHTILARKLTEIILVPLDETPAGTVAKAALEQITARMAWSDVVLAGPGLSRHPETDAVVDAVTATCGVPLVLDADALNALADDPQRLGRRQGPTVITPHTGELARLVNGDGGEIERKRVEASASAARRFQSVVVLKGAPTITARPDGTRIVNSTGNPGMATIGTGDVLAGLISGLIAQGVDPFTGAYGGVFLHGLAGDIAAERYGQRSLLAGDVLEHLGPAFQRVESE